ncbi:DnaD domain protein [Pediococcus sp. M21F004]|uniref:DnaD domain-containing protein n=1 Tax=Pediococcus sp. M21F004 TaxID=3390033 RepID=UPI003DA798AE
MSDGGWIKLYRKIRKSFVWTNSDQLKLWLLVLMKANHEPNKFLFNGKEVAVDSGQMVTGRDTLTIEFNEGVRRGQRISATTLWRWINDFKNAQMLDIKSSPQYSVITVSNWTTYQQSEQQVDNTWTSSGHQVDTNKNEKKEKNDKNVVVGDSNNPVNIWTDLWGFPNAIAQQDLTEWRNQFGDELVNYAINYAARRNVQSYGADKYLFKVFDGWSDLKITTVEQAKKEAEKHEQQQSNRRGGFIKNQIREKESLPDWAENQPTETKPMDPDAQAKLQKRLEVLRRRNDERT